MSITGKGALITGAGRAIGRPIAVCTAPDPVASFVSSIADCGETPCNSGDP